MIFYHGVSDFWFSPLATWDYYQRAAETNGAGFTDASRFYMVPGMLHCGGGNAFERFDLLGPLVEWVEQARHRTGRSTVRTGAPAPTMLHPSHRTTSGMTKPGSYQCRMPSAN